MPNIELIPDDICLYDALDPYHVHFDNKPLRNILARQKMINTAVDLNTEILVSAQGSTGSLVDRLNGSLQDNGNLIPAAVDFAMHTMDSHTDTVNYVRMTVDERDKLENIAPDATNLQLTFENVVPSNSIINFPADPLSAGVVVFANSPTASWRWTANQMYLDVTAAPASHIHFYDQEPGNPSSDYMTYYLPGFADLTSIRVYINGSRVSQASGYIPVASATGITSWALNSITINTNNFVLANPITQYDLITVDFDRSLS